MASIDRAYPVYWEAAVLIASATNKRVYLLANSAKSEAAAALHRLKLMVEARSTLVGLSEELDGSPAVGAGADRLIVLGGDGTLIGAARSLGRNQIAFIGVNIGKLGFLAEFSLDELERCFDQAVSDDGLVGRRSILDVSISRNGSDTESIPAVNDCVIQAGPPFRIIRLGVAINGSHLTELAGDGVILCTPSGSTAHNLSAGGPIMQPGVDAIVLTPLCPHSLTHRPLVMQRDAAIEIEALHVNDGTTLIVDGQVSYAVQPGDRITVRRYESDLLLVHNPLHQRWHNLTSKLHWGRAPNYD